MNCICSRNGSKDSRLITCGLMYVSASEIEDFISKSLESSKFIWSEPAGYFNNEIKRGGISDLSILFPVTLKHLKKKYWKARARVIFASLDEWIDNHLSNFVETLSNLMHEFQSNIYIGIYANVLGGKIHSKPCEIYEGSRDGYYVNPQQDIGLSKLIDELGDINSWEGHVIFQAIFPRIINGKLPYSDIIINFTANGKIDNQHAHCDCCCNQGGKRKICPFGNDLEGMREDFVRELREETALVPVQHASIYGDSFTWGNSGRYRGFWFNYCDFKFT